MANGLGLAIPGNQMYTYIRISQDTGSVWGPDVGTVIHTYFNSLVVFS